MMNMGYKSHVFASLWIIRQKGKRRHMMEHAALSKHEARRFLLLKHGLLGDYAFAGTQGAYEFVRQAGCIQYDPIDICGKNPELVLQSRVSGFTKDMLYDLLYNRRWLVDYFDKNMSIFAVSDWKYFQRQRSQYTVEDGGPAAIEAVVKKIKSLLREKGYLCSRDLPWDEKVDWSWNATSLARAALETLYFRGELIVHHKAGSMKYYALAEDHLPDDIRHASDPHATREEHVRWRILRRIGSVGLLWNKASDAWLGIEGLNAATRNRAFEELRATGALLPVKVEGIKVPLYCLTDDRLLLEQAAATEEGRTRMEFLAPLDNLLWDRELIAALFGFRYKWEIYTPAKQRQYGYYVLPILYNSRLIGRIEPIRDRKSSVLRIKNIWWEEGEQPDTRMKAALGRCLERFAVFNHCSRVALECNL